MKNFIRGLIIGFCGLWIFYFVFMFMLNMFLYLITNDAEQQLIWNIFNV